MLKRTNIAHLIGELHESSPSGFAIALHLTFATPTFLFQAYPAEWMAEYSERGMHLQDPTVIWGMTHTGTVRWSDLAGDDAIGIFELARIYGLNYGITVAVMHDGTRSVASFARSDREFTEAETEKLSGIVMKLHHETAGSEGLSEGDRVALKDMSIRLTHA